MLTEGTLTTRQVDLIFTLLAECFKGGTAPKGFSMRTVEQTQGMFAECDRLIISEKGRKALED